MLRQRIVHLANAFAMIFTRRRTTGLRHPVLSRPGLVIGLVLLALLASACYRDAGENVQPTSNRVDLTDLEPTTLPATETPTERPSVTATDPPDEPAGPTATRTLRPTITPAEVLPGQEDDADAAETGADDDAGADAASAEDDAPPTATEAQSPQIPPTFTPVVTAADDDVALETPGMNDIEPSATPAPTIDPTLRPTASPIPPGENPCVHVVQPNDTLYSIAQDNGVLLSDLVAANPTLLGGSEFTPLQIGWELQLPGCSTGEADTGAETVEDDTGAANDDGSANDDTGTEEQPPASEDGTITHTVQAGETIYAIGRLYNVDPDAIIAANNLLNPNQIQPGQVLIIPTG